MKKCDSGEEKIGPIRETVCDAVGLVVREGMMDVHEF